MLKTGTVVREYLGVSGPMRMIQNHRHSMAPIGHILCFVPVCCQLSAHDFRICSYFHLQSLDAHNLYQYACAQNFRPWRLAAKEISESALTFVVWRIALFGGEARKSVRKILQALAILGPQFGLLDIAMFQKQLVLGNSDFMITPSCPRCSASHGLSRRVIRSSFLG